MIWSLPLTSVDTRHPMQCTHIHAGRTLIYIKLSFQKFLFGGQSCSSQIDLKPWGLFISKRRAGFLHTDVVSCLRALPDTCFSVPQGVTIGNMPPNQGCWPVLHGFFAHSQESQAAFASLWEKTPILNPRVNFSKNVCLSHPRLHILMFTPTKGLLQFFNSLSALGLASTTPVRESISLYLIQLVTSKYKAEATPVSLHTL